MKKINKLIIIIASIILTVLLGLYIYYAHFYDETSFSVREMEWVNENRGTLIQIDIPNNINVFGYNGNGVFFDFFESLENYTELRFHKNATLIGAEVSDNAGFLITSEFIADALLMYQDHYILVGNEHKIIPYYHLIAGSSVGVLRETLPKIRNNYPERMDYTEFANFTELFEALEEEEVEFIIIPKMQHLDTILESELKVLFHFNDLVINYYLTFSQNDTLNSILEKFFRRYKRDSFEEVYYAFKYDLFVEALDLTQAQTDYLTNDVFRYGFVETTPLQTTRGQRQGGIIIEYLESFSRLTGVEFKHVLYSSYLPLVKDFNTGEIDLMLSNSAYSLAFYQISTGLHQRYYVVSPLDIRLNMNNIRDLIQTNYEVTVKSGTNIHHYLNNIHGININLVYTETELLRAARNNQILVVDAFFYHHYKNRGINNHSIRYVGYLENNYSFHYQNDEDAFFILFNAYMNVLDPTIVTKPGLMSFNEVSGANSFIRAVASYTLVIVTGALIIFGGVYYHKKNKNLVKLNSKIKKDDKLKYIDILTSLKNRNYLNAQKEKWNQNTIYPQAIIVLDLNRIKHINDTYGADAGDVQITAAANVLIKTQLDNTEVMRTDGNEFTIYLVGYNEKQVLNYIKKLVREFKELPYEYSAAVGFSMIVDDLKLIDDAITEALIQMRENKEISEEKDESGTATT